MPDSHHPRRILSLWFPRLAADRLRRIERGLSNAALAVVRESGNMRVLTSVSLEAETHGLWRGQALQEALTLCPDLRTRPAHEEREAAFLTALRRWAGKFSPWVSEQSPDGLLIDLTGCAHLFGGEVMLLAQVEGECADLDLSVRAGIADTAGAAWALARYAGHGSRSARSGDDIDQEARATRSRAGKRRHWERGGPAPLQSGPPSPKGKIAPPGHLRQAIGGLPVTALRVELEVTDALARLGLRRIEELFGMPRAALARRFGQGLVRRLDQALGLEPEPISPVRAPLHFAARLSLPEPIGLESDILAGLDRLLPVICERLHEKGRGARRLRLDIGRADGSSQMLEIGLARPADSPDRIRPLFTLKMGQVDPGFGIDTLRLEAHVTEPLHKAQMKGGWAVAEDTAARIATGPAQALDDLIGRLGARVGLEAITRHHPAKSHVPEKTEPVLAAAWSEPAAQWPAPVRPRPLTLFRPEPVAAPESADFPEKFRWRGRNFETLDALGPERIAPEWWLDDPNWRSGVRDYWRVRTDRGAILWLFYAHGGTVSGGWFAQGDFA